MSQYLKEKLNSEIIAHKRESQGSDNVQETNNDDDEDNEDEGEDEEDDEFWDQVDRDVEDRWFEKLREGGL